LIIGIICAIIHGAALPGGLYVFGDLSNLFASYDFSLQFHNIARLEMRNAYGNFSFDDDSTITSPLQSVNSMVVSPLVNLTSLNELVFNNTRPHYACLLTEYADSNMNNLTSPYDVLKEIVTNINYTLPVTTDSCSCLSSAIRILNDRARCYSTDTFFYGIQGVDGILWMVYLFIIVTLVVFLLAYVQISFTQLACERQVHKIRLAYYRAVLRQNIGWFDVNPSGELSSRLNDDIDKIHDGIGDKFVIMIQWFSTFISGFIVGLIKGWQLTLLLLALTPIMALSASVFSYVSQKCLNYMRIIIIVSVINLLYHWQVHIQLNFIIMKHLVLQKF
jgi:ATP-binding cassette subfamily B (MDR/TAP) protein 1